MLGGVARIVGPSSEDQAGMPLLMPKFRGMTTKNALRLTIYCSVELIDAFSCAKKWRLIMKIDRRSPLAAMPSCDALAPEIIQSVRRSERNFLKWPGA